MIPVSRIVRGQLLAHFYFSTRMIKTGWNRTTAYAAGSEINHNVRHVHYQLYPDNKFLDLITQPSRFFAAIPYAGTRPPPPALHPFSLIGPAVCFPQGSSGVSNECSSSSSTEATRTKKAHCRAPRTARMKRPGETADSPNPKRQTPPASANLISLASPADLPSLRSVCYLRSIPCLVARLSSIRSAVELHTFNTLMPMAHDTGLAVRERQKCLNSLWLR